MCALNGVRVECNFTQSVPIKSEQSKQRCDAFSLLWHISQTKLDSTCVRRSISDAFFLVLSTWRDKSQFWKHVCKQWHPSHFNPCFSEVEIFCVQLLQIAFKQGSRYGLWPSLSNWCLQFLQVMKSFNCFESAKKPRSPTENK